MFITLDKLDAIICTVTCSLFVISIVLMLVCICTEHDKWGIFCMFVTLAIITSAFVYSNWGRKVLHQKFSNQEVSQMEKKLDWIDAKVAVPDSPKKVLICLCNDGNLRYGFGSYCPEDEKWIVDDYTSNDTVIKWFDIPKLPDLSNDEPETNEEIVNTLIDLVTRVNTMESVLGEIKETVERIDNYKH